MLVFWLRIQAYGFWHFRVLFHLPFLLLPFSASSSFLSFAFSLLVSKMMICLLPACCIWGSSYLFSYASSFREMLPLCPCCDSWGPQEEQCHLLPWNEVLPNESHCKHPHFLNNRISVSFFYILSLVLVPGVPPFALWLSSLSSSPPYW